MAKGRPGGLVLRQVGTGLAAALLLLVLGSPANAAHCATGTASVHVSLSYDPARSVWRGNFRAVRPHGTIVAHGRAVDSLRRTNSAEWTITRRLSTRAGTLQFRISGPDSRLPTARLHWLVVGGTGAYAALQGHGVDVEHLHGTRATAVMRGVPFPSPS